jgi:hypothetical protein
MGVDDEEHRLGGFRLTRFGKVMLVVWKVATHPVMGLVVAIAVGFSTYFLSKSTKEPVFTVSPTELVAQTVNGEGNLKILWQDKEIQNAASVKIAFWNQGSQYIDRNDISTTEPLRFQSTEKVQILSVSQLASSRAAVKFSWHKEIDGQGGESAVLNIEGDEALERFDGAAFHILFSGPLNSAWIVAGRIKGVPEGFSKKDWSKIQPPEHTERRKLIIIAIILGLFTVGLISFEIYSAIRWHHPLRWWRFAAMLLYSLVLIGASFSSNIGYLFVPHWLPR